MKTAAVLFSGGADCTLAAAQAAQRGDFDEVVLLTYLVPVSCMDDNSRRNVPHLERAFPQVSFHQEMLPVGPLLEKVISKHRWRFVAKHGLIEASLCLHCRLAMHVRTIMYCLDAGIRDVFDGSNITMALWVDQTRRGIQMVDELYAAFGITIQHPVFYDAGDDLFDLVKYLSDEDRRKLVPRSTSRQLHELGILADPGQKSDFAASYRAQPVCLGVVMSLMHSIGTVLPFRSYDSYNRDALRWYESKTTLFRTLLVDYRARRADSELGRACCG